MKVGSVVLIDGRWANNYVCQKKKDKKKTKKRRKKRRKEFMMKKRQKKDKKKITDCQIEFVEIFFMVYTTLSSRRVIAKNKHHTTQHQEREKHTECAK